MVGRKTSSGTGQSCQEAPVLVVDFADARTNADPFPVFARLRREDPVHYSQPMKSWIVTRYDDVKAIAMNNAEVSANRLAPFFAAQPAERSVYTNLMTYLGHWMVFRDPPDHTRLRRLFTKAFTSRSVDQVTPNIESIVAMLFDEMEQKARANGGVADWIADFAYPLPASVIMDLLGVPREDLKQVKVWSDAIALFIGIARASEDKYRRAEAGARAMADYFRGIVEKRTAEPRDDLISQMVIARDEKEAMTADEVIATCILLLFAGHETTTNLLGNGLYHAFGFPGELERLRADPALAEATIEEWLRYDGPSGALARVVAEDVEFGGKLLRKGQRVLAFTSAANRDEAVFRDPDRMSFSRDPNPHMAFGHGIHFCLGAPLARVEGQIAARQMVDRFPRMRRATEGELEWHDSVILRGLKSLPVRID